MYFRFRAYAKPIHYVFYIFLISLLLTVSAKGAEVQLTWDPNDPEPSGYRIYSKLEGDAFDFTTPSWEGGSTSCTITGLNEGQTYVFVARAFDDEGVESGNSNVVTYTVPCTSEGCQDPVLEAWEVTADHNWTRVVFSKSYNTPIVIASSLGINGGFPAVVRIRNIDRDGFELRVEEWDYLDGLHAEETIGFIVMEQGQYTLQDGSKIEAGQFESNGTNAFEPVGFKNAFGEIPVVITTVASDNEAATVTHRLKNITTQGFGFYLQGQELNPAHDQIETINYIAWEPSSGDIDGQLFEVNRTGMSVNSHFYNIQFQQLFTAPPVFISDMQTTYGTNTANLRWKDRYSRSIAIQVDEEQSLDEEIGHCNEEVGYILLENE